MRIQSKIVVGYHLGNYTSQISYSYLTEEETVTLPRERGSIPTQLCKRIGMNQWFFGGEAKRMAGNTDVITVSHLLEQALLGSVIQVDGNAYQAKDLLVVFIQKSMELIKMEASYEQIQLFVITVEELNEQMIRLLDEIVVKLPIRKHIIMYQGKEEAFFHYIIKDPTVCMNQVLLVDGTEKHLKIFRLEMDQNITPVVAFVEKTEYTFLETSDEGIGKSGLQYDSKKLDQELLILLKKLLEEHEISALFLFGDFFISQWCEDTLAYLKEPYRITQGKEIGSSDRYRKVFIGNNLVSKGNCYFAKNMIKGNRVEEQYIFLGNDKLKSDISIQTMENGNVIIKKMLEAGSIWYEASCNIDFIMHQDLELRFFIEMYQLKEKRIVSMKLAGMPARPPRTTRIKVRMRMITESLVEIQVEDLGFGNLYPSSKLAWNEEIELE
ncbi:MAG: DUF5716 family protein [Eubacteriales bacterium]